MVEAAAGGYPCGLHAQPPPPERRRQRQGRDADSLDPIEIDSDYDYDDQHRHRKADAAAEPRQEHCRSHAGLEVDPLHHGKDARGIPGDVADLIEHIKAVSNGDKIIPQSMAEDVKKGLDLLDPAIDDRNTYAANRWLPDADADGQDDSITWDVADEFRMLQKIVAKTSECDAEYLSEPSWNCTVHHPLLELALAPFQGSVSHWDVTKAPITKAYHPLHSSGNDLQGKMVDFCVTLDSEAIRHRVIERLKTSNHESIAHTEYPALRFRPIAISIETKTPGGSTETARTQLAVWASAHIARLRELAATADDAAGLGITLPLISIRGAEWDLLFAVDHATSVEIVRIGPIGDTTSIVSCYKLLAMIRWLTVWVTGTFCEWMVKNALVVS
ncbi:hypothetical protein QQZ08_004637 [Neonectria magnoliae]|uniref:PD-(D/E)XK nuclease-like domain-containing protein n=1 Tax=Neonectria magnoliae TaxID=2732573 RepID=A0ABR1I7P9_9HYPO